MLKVFRSCDIERLGDILKQGIKDNKDFFNSPFVVFKNVNTEKWFKTYWLKTEDNILMNVLFGRMNDLIINMSCGNRDIVKENDVMMAITEVVTSGKDIDEFVKGYCFSDGVISAVKTRDFAKELASFLVKADLNEIKLDGWRSKLFNNVKEVLEKKNLYFVSDIVKNDYKKNKKIFVFASFHLDKLYLDYLKRLSSDNEVTVLMLGSTEDKGKDFLRVYDEDYASLGVDSAVVNKDGSIKPTVTVAPSRIREIEVVHSKICELLKKNDVKTSDFLVVAPNIGEYVNDIARVFHQDDEDFIDIPYVVKTSMKKKSSLYEALDTLFDIYLKGFYTRYDVYKLVSNRLIQRVRGIDDSDVSSFIDAFVDMKIYRKRPSFDDFDFGKKRILISKLVGGVSTLDNVVDLDTIKAKPYSSIELDDERIVKLDSVIDDLNSFLGLGCDFLSHIEEELSKWFSLNDNGVETNKLYKKVISLINRFKEMNSDNITLELLLTYIKDATMISCGSGGEVFTSGVTFTDLSEGAILPARFVFIIGFNSNVMPRRDAINEFYDKDLFISNLDLDKCAFYIQAVNAKDGLYISYLGKNLKTDESYYPSTLLDLLDGSKYVKYEHKKDKEGKEIIDTKVIDIDETRSYRELYTRKEYKNKDYYKGLFTSKEEKEDKKSEEEYQYTYTDIVKLSDFKHFLEEPLKEKAERLMKKKESNLDDAKEEYEPLDFDNLDEYNYIRDLLSQMMKKDEDFTDEEIIEDFKEELEKESPEIGEYKELELNVLVDKAKEVKEELLDINDSDYEIKSLTDLVMSVNDLDGITHEWTLSCNNEMYVYDDHNHTVYYGMLKAFGEKPYASDYFDLYLFSLMDIASRDDDEEYNIFLYRDIKKNEKRIRDYSISKEAAISLLNKLYLAYNDYHNNKLIPMKKDVYSRVDSLYSLFDNAVNKHGAWEYFEDKWMFDYETQYGYNEDNFNDEWADAKTNHLKLIKFLGGDADE